MSRPISQWRALLNSKMVLFVMIARAPDKLNRLRLSPSSVANSVLNGRQNLTPPNMKKLADGKPRAWSFYRSYSEPTRSLLSPGYRRLRRITIPAIARTANEADDGSGTAEVVMVALLK